MIDETALAVTIVLDEAVTIHVAMTVDPAKRGLDIRPDSTKRVEIAGSFDVGAGKNDEKWR